MCNATKALILTEFYRYGGNVCVCVRRAIDSLRQFENRAMLQFVIGSNYLSVGKQLFD